MNQEYISRRERFCYGLGDFAQNGMFTFMSSYAMFYLTDIAKIPLGLAGLLILAGRVVDALVSPLAGGVIDRMGRTDDKCRFAMKCCMIPGILFFSLFYLASVFPAVIKTFCIVVFYFLYCVFYAVISVSYTTLLSRVTRDERQRLSFNLYKNVGAAVGGLAVSAITLKIVELFGANARLGYGITTILFGTAFFVCEILCISNTRERIIENDVRRIDIKSSIKHTFRSKAFLILCGVQSLEMFFFAMRTQGVVYYTKYCLGNDSMGAVLLSLTQILSLSVAFVMPYISSKIGNKRCVLYGNVIWCIGIAATWLAGSSYYPVIFAGIVTGLGWSVATGIVFVMISDTIAYTEAQTGYRMDGFITASLIFVMKLGSALAGFAFPFVLKLGGYDSEAINTTEQVKNAIRVNFLLIPLIASMIAVGLISIYPTLTHQQVNREGEA